MAFPCHLPVELWAFSANWTFNFQFEVKMLTFGINIMLSDFYLNSCKFPQFTKKSSNMIFDKIKSCNKWQKCEKKSISAEKLHPSVCDCRRCHRRHPPSGSNSIIPDTCLRGCVRFVVHDGSRENGSGFPQLAVWWQQKCTLQSMASFWIWWFNSLWWCDTRRGIIKL